MANRIAYLTEIVRPYAKDIRQHVEHLPAIIARAPLSTFEAVEVYLASHDPNDVIAAIGRYLAENRHLTNALIAAYDGVARRTVAAWPIENALLRCTAIIRREILTAEGNYGVIRTILNAIFLPTDATDNVVAVVFGNSGQGR